MQLLITQLLSQKLRPVLDHPVIYSIHMPVVHMLHTSAVVGNPNLLF